MIVFSHTLSGKLVNDLADCLAAGPMIDDRGSRTLNEEEVSRIGKMSVQIQSDEHPPPHFHIMFAGENASFAIADGKRLPGIRGLEKYDRNIRKWWKANRCELILAWNRLRPTDCPVGTIAVPSECAPS